MFDRIRKSMFKLAKEIRARLSRLNRAQWGRLGYYAALALLLVILGAASHRYRVRRDAGAANDAPFSAPVAAQAVAPTPSPSPEPPQWIWPLEGEIVGEYAARQPMWSATLAQWQTHPAIDIAGHPGEAVYACRYGVVSDAWRDGLWGNVIVIDHDDGWQSTYAGLNTLKLVEIGQTVKMGEVISAVGQSLPCEAELPNHIHFALTRDGEPMSLLEILNPEAKTGN